MIEINTKEWKFVAFLSVAIIIITFLPIFIGLVLTPQDSIFWGRQATNAEDTPVYYSWIEQAKEGHLLFKSLYTATDEPRYIFDPFWLSIGLFAKFFSLSSFAACQLARFFLIPIFLGLAYIFVSYFFEEAAKRKICFIFLVFASGLGGFFAMSNFRPPPMDLWVSEAITFYTLYHSPHFIASLASMLLIFLLLLCAFEKKKIFYSVLAGLVALVFFLFHPYYVPTIFGVVGAYIVIQSLRYSKIRWDLIKHYLLLILISAPAIFYQLWTINTFLGRMQHALQNNLSTPPFYNLWITYGLLLPLSCCGIAYLFQKKLTSDKNVFLLTWWGMQWFLPYLPFFNYQRKLLEGFHVVITILAIFGIFALKELLTKKIFFPIYFFRKKVVLVILFILFFTFSNFFVVIRDLYFYASQSPHAYLKKEKLAAMIWLKENTAESSLIFASYANGNLIPAFALRRPYAGHWGISASPGIKINQFFENFDDQARVVFLKINKLDYLFYGPEEQEFKNFKPEEKDYLREVYRNKEVGIYKIL
jgi:hypothetical protein